MKLGLSDRDADFLRNLGGGSVQRGLELAIRLSKASLEVYTAHQREKERAAAPPVEEKNRDKYSSSEAALIRSRNAPCLNCNCDDGQRAICEAW